MLTDGMMSTDMNHLREKKRCGISFGGLGIVPYAVRLAAKLLIRREVAVVVHEP